jgi:hypothetical protein
MNEKSQESFINRVLKALKRLILGISEGEDAWKKRAKRLNRGAQFNQLIQENRGINLDMPGQKSLLFSSHDQQTRFHKLEIVRLIQNLYPEKCIRRNSLLEEQMFQTVRSGL